MAVWAPDLHDGDLYLPSDIFPDDADPIHTSGTNIGMGNQAGTLRHPEEMGLEWKLAALGMFDPHHQFRSSSSTCMPPVSMREGFRPEPHRGAGCSFGHGSSYAIPVGGGRQRSWMAPPMIAPDKVAMTVEEMVGKRLEKARYIQRHAHCYPLRRSGRLLGGSSGTGVFIPCISNNNDPGKHAGMMKSRGEQRRPLQQTRMAGLRGKSATPFQLNDMGLPQDWTYSP